MNDLFELTRIQLIYLLRTFASTEYFQLSGKETTPEEKERIVENAFFLLNCDEIMNVIFMLDEDTDAEQYKILTNSIDPNKYKE